MRKDLPKPIAYVEHEGDYYKRWVPTEITRREHEAWAANFGDKDGIPLNVMQGDACRNAYRQIPRNAAQAHAIFFDDGSVFDMVNGWRTMTDQDRRTTMRDIRLSLGEIIDNQLSLDKAV